MNEVSDVAGQAEPVKVMSVTRPGRGAVKAIPWTRERVYDMRDALPGRNKVVPELAPELA